MDRIGKEGRETALEYTTPSIQTRQALEELQRYLSDQLAPMMVLDSITMLLERPPELAAVQIQAWTTAQYRFHHSSVPMSSYLFHALKKLQMMVDYKLIAREPMKRYLDVLAAIVVQQYCPEEERELLHQNLMMLGQSESSVTEGVQILHWPGEGGPVPVGGGGAGRAPVAAGTAAGPAPSAGASISDEAAKGLRRFSLLVDQLARLPAAPTFAASAMPEVQSNIVSQLLTTAAVNSHSSSELDAYLGRLRAAGVEPRTDEAFRLLARSLPGWGVLVPAEGGAAPMTPGGDGPLGAMHKLVTLSEDVEEGATRFSQMMQAAIEQFNQGNLGAAVAMFDLAGRIIEENRLSPGLLKSIYHRAHESLDMKRLAKLAEKPEKHAFLRRVLLFFPDLTPRGLLDQLEHEPRREHRKLLLALLEAHGEPARTVAYGDLKEAVGGSRRDMNPFHLRNLIFLMRRIARAIEEPWDEELEYIIRLTGREYAPIVRREALAVLGSMKHERAEHALVARARECEETLSRPVTDPRIDAQELVLLLDRAIYSLARYGTQPAWRAVVEHGLRTQPALGDTLSRLSYLSSLDLREDPEVVARILRALKEQLPIKVLGFAIPRKHDAAAHLIRALSSTPSPSVQHAFDDIVRRFPDTEFSALASKALATFGVGARAPEPAATTLAGDLELFGLPNLLQSLSESSVTGTLVLSDPNGETMGTLHFDQGRVGECQAGALRGEMAVYQLFEKPLPGTFVLRTRRDGIPELESSEPPREVLPLVLEAVRRHDELRKARALVPDGTAYKPTGVKPTRTREEPDVNFLRALWAKITQGMKPEQCEATIAVDAYRIRSLVAHWLEEGSVTLR